MVLLGFILLPNAYAETILQWTGTVIEISDPDSVIGSKVSVGDIVTNTWKADPTSGTANLNSEFFGITTDYDNPCNYVAINSFSWLNSGDQGARVANDRTYDDNVNPPITPADGYVLFGSNVYTQTTGTPFLLLELDLILADSTAGVFSDESLPSSMDIADFDDKILEDATTFPIEENFDAQVFFGEMTGFFEGSLAVDVTSISTAEFCPPVPMAVGGEFIGVDTTALLVTGAQMNAAWLIPVIVSGIGFAIVIARKF